MNTTGGAFAGDPEVQLGSDLGHFRLSFSQVEVCCSGVLAVRGEALIKFAAHGSERGSGHLCICARIIL